jgi:hypothetical protein
VVVSGGGLDVAALVAAGVGPEVGGRGSLLVSVCAALRDPRSGNVRISELTYLFEASYRIRFIVRYKVLLLEVINYVSALLVLE